MDHGVVECLGLEGASVLDILKDSVVYVSGRINVDDYATSCRQFADARDWLRRHGAAHVTTPTRLVDSSLGYDQAVRERIHELTKRDYDASEGGLVRRPWYDLIVMLEGWKVTSAARIECEVALASGIYAISLNRLKLKHHQERQRINDEFAVLREFADRRVVESLEEMGAIPKKSE